MKLHAWRRGAPFAIGFVVFCLGFAVDAHGQLGGTSEPTVRAEVARGASAIGAITTKKYPYPAIHRLIRDCLEKNVQVHRDSDGFLVGAHLVAASWAERLPSDVSWRETALTRPSDIVERLAPRTGLSDDDLTRTVARAAGFTPAARRRLARLVRRIRRPASH
jgi:hypothetical protein